jgi:hypothetical protein
VLEEQQRDERREEEGDGEVLVQGSNGGTAGKEADSCGFMPNTNDKGRLADSKGCNYTYIIEELYHYLSEHKTHGNVGTDRLHEASSK